ncbi:hypothetical protein FB451DRAFT_1358570 [Mycena latifolia]|nr:hypothetical protein FB451DRAFT_1361073 [Mycena latifolia]KAJ7499357.1 hypothetical protein FB451DRAFT_1358570 [Mycena latifolia]
MHRPFVEGHTRTSDPSSCGPRTLHIIDDSWKLEREHIRLNRAPLALAQPPVVRRPFPAHPALHAALAPSPAHCVHRHEHEARVYRCGAGLGGRHGHVDDDEGGWCAGRCMTDQGPSTGRLALTRAALGPGCSRCRSRVTAPSTVRSAFPSMLRINGSTASKSGKSLGGAQQRLHGTRPKSCGCRCLRIDVAPLITFLIRPLYATVHARWIGALAETIPRAGEVPQPARLCVLFWIVVFRSQ